MRKFAMMAVLLFTAWVGVSAQESEDEGFKRRLFNHVGVNAGVGLEGISIGVAAPVTNFFEIEAGINFVPDFKVKGDIKIPSQEITVSQAGYSQTVNTPADAKLNAEGGFKRTTGHVKVYLYPFGGNTSFFIAGGLSFGGQKLATLSGYSPDLEKFVNQYPEYKQQILDEVGANLAGYKLTLNEDFRVNGDIRCKKVRPYIGLGYGRSVLKHRIGFRVESGVQFMGNLKVFQNDEEIDLDQILKDATGDDKISDLVKKINIYPCLKVALSVRLF